MPWWCISTCLDSYIRRESRDALFLFYAKSLFSFCFFHEIQDGRGRGGGGGGGGGAFLREVESRDVAGKLCDSSASTSP